MLKRTLVVAAMLAVSSALPSATVAARESASSDNAKSAPVVAHVKGVLLSAESKPIADKTIYLLFYSENDQLVTLPGGVSAIQHSRTVRYSMVEGKIVNPSATTDSSGAFLIPLGMKDAGGRFALGYIENERSTAALRASDNGYILVQVPNPAVDIDLGSLVTKTKEEQRSN